MLIKDWSASPRTVHLVDIRHAHPWNIFLHLSEFHPAYCLFLEIILSTCQFPVQFLLHLKLQDLKHASNKNVQAFLSKRLNWFATPDLDAYIIQAPS